MPDYKRYLWRLNHDLSILREREAKYGLSPPVKLLNQIEDIGTAINLTSQFLAGNLEEAQLQQSLKPLLIPAYEDSTTNLTQFAEIVSALERKTHTIAEQNRSQQALEQDILTRSVLDYSQNLRQQLKRYNHNNSPYRGLLSYRLQDASYFFGRAKAIEALRKRFQRSALTILHAESGVGKTSLLQAGIMPDLIRQGHLPVYLRPFGYSPSTAFKRIFVPSQTVAPGLFDMPLRVFLQHICQILDYKATIYIIFDQFEEFFIHLKDRGRNAKNHPFAADLAECITDPNLKVCWILALRAEYFSNLADLRTYLRKPFENDFRLDRLTGTEAQAVITEPAIQFGLKYEAGLVETILGDLQRPNLLTPQIQLVCQTLFQDKAQNETIITAALYNRLGKAQGILNKHLEHALKKNFKPPERKLAYQILEALVTADGKRAIRTQSELLAEINRTGSSQTDPQVLSDVVTELIESFLLHVIEANNGKTGSGYELAHDYLADQIELNPETLARKAAQELLQRAMLDWEAYAALMRPQTLQVISAQREVLQIDAGAEEMLVESAFETGVDLTAWLAFISAENARKALFDNLNKSDNPVCRQRAALQSTNYLNDALASRLWEIAVNDSNKAVWQTALITLAASQADLGQTARQSLLKASIARQAEAYALLKSQPLHLPVSFRWRMVPVRLISYLKYEIQNRPWWTLVRMGLILALYFGLAWWQGWPPFLRWEPVAGVPREALFSIVTVNNQPQYIGSYHYGVSRQMPDGSWSNWLNNGLPGAEYANTGQIPAVVALAVPTNKPDHLYALLAEHGLYQSLNGGESWRAIPVEGVSAGEQSVAVRENVLLLGDQTAGVFSSDDGGNTWLKLSGNNGLPEAGFEVVRFNSEGVPYAGGTDGLYQGEGEYPWQWQKIEGIPSVGYLDFGPQGELYLGIGWLRATLAACYLPSGELVAVENFGDNAITALAAHPDEAHVFYTATTNGVYELGCDNHYKNLGQVPGVRGSGNLLILHDNARDRLILIQANSQGLFQRLP